MNLSVIKGLLDFVPVDYKSDYRATKPTVPPRKIINAFER